MTFVARYSTTIHQDIELGFSCFLGDLGTDLLSALEIDGYNAETLEAKYERFGNEDQSFEEYLKSSVLDEGHIVWDTRFNAYRTFHHSGLSCYKLNATTETEALIEVESKSVDAFGFGQQTIGSIRVVAEVRENVWLLECDDAKDETF